MASWPDVLIIEDDDSLRYLTSEVFILEGIQAATAADGCQAMDYFRETLKRGGAMPRIIILDIMMPCMDGYEVYGQIADEPWMQNVTVVVASAAGEEMTILEDPPRIYVLRKPYDVEKLLGIVRDVAPELFSSPA